MSAAVAVSCIANPENELPMIEDIKLRLQSCREKNDIFAAKQMHMYVHGIGLENHFGNYLVPMFVDCGSIADAVQVFFKLSSPNEFACTSLIQGYMDCGKPHYAFNMFQIMLDRFVIPSKFTFLAIVRGCAKWMYTDEGHEVHTKIVEEGYETDQFLGNTVIDMYAKFGMLLEASDVYNDLECRDVVSCNVLMAGFVEHNFTNEALSFVEEMQSQSIVPDAITYVNGIKCCGKMQELSKGQEFHQEIMLKGFEMDPILCSTLVDMYAKCTSYLEAENILEQYGCHGTQDVVMWTSLISGFSEYGRIEDAFDCLEKMLIKGISPDAVTLICILKGCTGICITFGQKIHMEIVKQGFEDDIYATNTLIDMYSNFGLFNEAQKVFDEMLVQDVVSWSVLIGGYVEQRQGEEALNRMMEMVTKGFSPDFVTYICSLKACYILGRRTLGEQLHGEIVKKGLEAEYLVGNTLVDFYCNCGALLESHAVFGKLTIRDAVSWNALLAGYVTHGFPEEALDSFMQMQCEGFSPAPITYIYVLKASQSVGSLDPGRELHAQIIKKGFDNDPFICSNLLDVYFKYHSVCDALKVFNELQDHDSVVWNSLVSGFATLGDNEVAFRCCAKMQEQALLPNEIVFVSMLRACSNASDLKIGERIHAQSYMAFGFSEGNMILATAIIDMYGRCGSVRNAKVVFDSIQNADRVMWTALITAYAQQGESEAVFLTFERMKEAGIWPDEITFIHLLSACSHDGLVDKGRKFFDSMTAECAIIPSIEHYNCMVDLYGRAGQLEAVFDMLRTMTVELDNVTWNTLLGACSRWSSIEIGRTAFDCLVELDDKQPASFILLSNMYADLPSIV